MAARARCIGFICRYDCRIYRRFDLCVLPLVTTVLNKIHGISVMYVSCRFNMPKVLPKLDEYRDLKGDGSAFDPYPKIPVAEIIYFPNTPDHQIELWLKLADSALRRCAARRKRLLQ